MTYIQSLVLGIVQGLTEYLPVSSTGHLLITQQLLGIPKSEAIEAFHVFLHAGSILAVLALYRQRVVEMLLGLLGKNPAGLRLLVNLICAFVPAVVIGLAFEKHIKAFLYGAWPVVAAWFVGGVGVLIYVRWRKARGGENQGLGIADLTWKKAIVIGLCQCVAMWPGMSRSLMTMLGGMFMGLRVTAAVEFSFLLALVTISAASAKETFEFGSLMFTEFGPVPIAIGFVASFLSAWCAVKWAVSYLQKRSFAVFGWYRIVIAIVVAALIIGGIITAHEPEEAPYKGTEGAELLLEGE